MAKQGIHIGRVFTMNEPQLTEAQIDAIAEKAAALKTA